MAAAESTSFFDLVAACAYGTLEYVKSLHQAFHNAKDPLPKMLNIAILHNRPEIAEYCIVAGARVTFAENPYNLHRRIVTGRSYETCKVLVEHGLNINDPIEYFGDILQCAVEVDNLDWVRFCLRSGANPRLKPNFNGHLILATAATFASIQISELLIAWGAEMTGSSALTIASHRGRLDLVELLLKNGADANEMGVASIDDDPEDFEGTALHLIEKGREDILQILLDHGADVNKRDCMGGKGKTVMSRMYANGDEALMSIVMKNGGEWWWSYLDQLEVPLPAASTSQNSSSKPPLASEPIEQILSISAFGCSWGSKVNFNVINDVFYMYTGVQHTTTRSSYHIMTPPYL